MAPFESKTYLAISLDPIHVGTGEFRLGRVDNTIVREPGTNLPKIPGSSLAGTARAYTAMAEGKYRRPDGKSCAGKGGPEGEDHCGESNCPVCTTYGFSKKGRSFQGLAQFGDARIIFFPVYSVAGPIWITCPTMLQDAGCEPDGDGQTKWSDIDSALQNPQEPFFYPLDKNLPDRMNLGWLYLQRPENLPLAISPGDWTIGGNKSLEVSWLKPVLDRLVLVSSSLFSAIVDDQLEVRTSVSISPSTGAAEDGALFTTEAIPRATVFFFTAIFLDPNNFRVPTTGGPAEISLGNGLTVRKAAEKGLSFMGSLGVGGINTRGMGRFRVFV